MPNLRDFLGRGCQESLSREITFDAGTSQVQPMVIIDVLQFQVILSSCFCFNGCFDSSGITKRQATIINKSYFDC